MKRTQNEKILQIKNNTLVVRINIAKRIHFARTFDNRGIELGKLLKFENSAQGFAADTWLKAIQQKHRMTEAIVGFKPTGHYWFNLGDHLEAYGTSWLSSILTIQNVPANSMAIVPARANRRIPKPSQCLSKMLATGMFTSQMVLTKNYGSWFRKESVFRNGLNH